MIGCSSTLDLRSGEDDVPSVSSVGEASTGSADGGGEEERVSAMVSALLSSLPFDTFMISPEGTKATASKQHDDSCLCDMISVLETDLRTNPPEFR